MGAFVGTWIIAQHSLAESNRIKLNANFFSIWSVAPGLFTRKRGLPDKLGVLEENIITTADEDVFSWIVCKQSTNESYIGRCMKERTWDSKKK